MGDEIRFMKVILGLALVAIALNALTVLLILYRNQ